MPHTALSFYKIVKANRYDNRYSLYIGLNLDGDSVSDLAIECGEDPDDYHVTLLYGYFTPQSDIEDSEVRIQSAIDEIKKDIPDRVVFFHEERFEASESSDKKDVIVARAEGEALYDAHNKIIKALKRHGIKVEQTFHDYKPHMTLAYIEPGTEYELRVLDHSADIKDISLDIEPEYSEGHEHTRHIQIYDKNSIEESDMAKSFSEVMKFNPNHDARGRFASGGSAASFTWKPGASAAHDKAIAIEKERNSSSGCDGAVAVSSTGNELSKEQQEFFKDSKMRDDNGNLLEVYHGTQEGGFTVFDSSQSYSENISGAAHFFSTNKEMIDKYYNVDNSYLDGSKQVYTCYLNAKNPLVIDCRSNAWNTIELPEELQCKGINRYRDYTQGKYVESARASTDQIASYAKNNGYDGVVYKNVRDGSIEEKPSDVYAVFESHQIKSVTNKKPSSDEDITKSKGEGMEDSVFHIAKADEDQRLVFGWALVSERTDGEMIIDHQGDIVDPEELEKGAYEYVLNFRDAGEEHIGTLRKKAKMVESCVFTPEKMKALGIPDGTVPVGWWIGFHVDDDDTWEKIKNGTYNMFSIEGKAVREPVNEPVAKNAFDEWLEDHLDADEETQLRMKEKLDRPMAVAKSFSEIVEKFNPYHDRLGRFATGGGFMNSGWAGPADKQARTFSANPETRAGAMAIARESSMSHETIGRAYGLGSTKPAPGNKQPKPQKPKPQKPTAEKPKTEKPKAEKPQESNFTPAKTKKAATEYAKKELGFERVSYGSKLDIDTINHINKQVSDIQTKYPELKGAVQEVKTSSSGRMYACIETDRTGRMTLKVSSKLYGNGLDVLERQYKADCDVGFHPKGTSAKDIVWHEYGHVYAGVQSKKAVGVGSKETISPFDGGKSVDFIMNRRSGTYEKGIANTASKSLGKSVGTMQKNISRYAQKNVKELFAEAFAEFNSSPNPSPECIALMKAAGIFK